MRFILFFLLRRFFVRVDFDSQKIVVTKGIFVIRTATVPLKSIVRITVRRSLFLRVFRAKEVEVFCNLGSVKFFLGRDEVFQPFGIPPRSALNWKSASLAEETLGAFCDTHALGGIFLFAAALVRSGQLLGDEYSERLSALLQSLISDTAANVSAVLSTFQIFVPRAAAVVAVFALFSWCYAFAKKLLNLMRFRVAAIGERAYVQSGVFTLYEHKLILNSSNAVCEESVLSLISGRAVVRVRGVIVFPSVRRKRCENNLSSARGHTVRSPWSAFWGHCEVPLTVAVVLGAALIALSESSAELLKTALLCGFAAALYSGIVCAVYMRFSGISAVERGVILTARRGLRLLSAVIPRERVVCVAQRRNLFNKERGNLKIFTRERLRFKVRQLSLSEAAKLSERS